MEEEISLGEYDSDKFKEYYNLDSNYVEKLEQYMVGGHKKLSKTEAKYCNCLMHVRPKNNPYGICTKTVYKDQKRTKRVDCDNHYDFSKYEMDELKALAKEKKIGVSNLGHNQLANKLQNKLGSNLPKKYLIKKY